MSQETETRFSDTVKYYIVFPQQVFTLQEICPTKIVSPDPPRFHSPHLTK